MSLQIEKSLEMTVSHQIEKSLEMTAPPNWGKFKMTVFHQIEKSLEMTVSHQIEKSFRNDCAPPDLEMTVSHQIEKQFRNECTLCSTKLRKVLEMTMFHHI